MCETTSHGIRGDVRYENVSFSYGDGHAPALQQINFHAQPGETIALVGTTGAGKSTLVNLLDPFLRIQLRRDHDRRETDSRFRSPRLARDDRGGDPGEFSFQRNDPRKPAHRETGRDR